MKPGVDFSPELVGVVGCTGGVADESKSSEGSLGARSAALQVRIEAASVTSGHGWGGHIVPVGRRGGGGGAGGGRAEPREFVANSCGDG